jgi:hypothetical protein
MQPSQQNYQELINKLDAFIRKYYTNQLIRGGIYAFTLLLGFFLAVTLLESFAWFSTTVRSILFYCYLLATAIVLGRLVIIPLMKLYRLGTIITHTEAAAIVGKHFPHIQDKLLNTLQLHHLADTASADIELIHASINQKSAELRPVPFTAAVDLSRNRRYLRYAAVPAVIFLVMLVAAPSLITDPTRRLLKHNTAFSKPAPFDFTIEEKKLTVTQFEDFTIHVKMSGKEIPQEVYLAANGSQYRLEKDNTVSFHHTFRNVQSTTSFQLLADGYNSEEYTLEVVPNPLVVSFGVSLDYPAYLGKKDETLKNTGDLIVPVGTKVRWNFSTQNTSSLRIRFNDSTYVLQEETDEFIFARRAMNTMHYSIRTSNRFMDARDSMQYNIMVIPDQHPVIEVEESKDENSYQRLYFRGVCRDDYGLSKLQFRYRFIKREAQDVQEEMQSTIIRLQQNSTQEQFFHYWDLATLGLKAGDELEYYFEVWDNDGVHGAKSSRSQSNIFKAPSLNELAKDAAEKNKATKDDLAESLRKAKELQQEMAEMQRDLVNKKNLGFEDRKKIADILQKQKDLQKQIEELQKENQENMQRQQELRQQDNELAEKQQKLQELFEQLMSPEMKAKMEELEKLMAQIDKKELQEMVDKMKLDNKDLEKQLDRTLELFKQLELEQKMKETAEQLDQLAKKQEELAEKSEEKNADAEKLQEEQKELGKEFDEIKKELEDIEKKNEELEYSQDMEKFDQDEEAIDKDMEQSEQELGEKKSQKASKSQKSAGQKMKQLSEKIQKSQKKQQQEQNEEDEQALRALLENLLRFSFDQEKLMQELKQIDVNNPRYLKLAQEQRKLKDDAKVLEDSLLALSKRVVQISSSVNEQITDINDNVGKAIENLQDRQVPMARANQQFIMTAVNNLALLLSESLDQMQQQMAQSMPSSGECKKPGKAKPGPTAGDVKKMQEKLSQQLQEMKEKLKNGAKPGGEQKGGKGKDGQSGMSEELAKMAAQQEALRNAINQLNQQENKDGTGKLGDLQKIAQQMEENEKDIVNKRITDMTLKRQQEILTRLLESEKAERQREEEQRRESQEAQDINRNPPQFEEYKKLQLKETELLKTIPPGFTGFYKNLVNSYFQSLED